MAGNKVKFHTLERLDLVDVEAIQNNRQDYDLLQLGEIMGLGEGCLRPFNGFNADNEANTVSLPGFSFVAAYQSAPRKGYVHVYDDTADGNFPSDGLISFETPLAQIQSYYATNGSLPTAPIVANRDTYSETTHGSYYPYIWAQAVEVEDAQDQRRFWSAASAQEVTSVVNTRKTHKTQIIISASRPNTPSGGFDWAKVGRVTEWGVTNNVVSLVAIRPIMATESLLGLDPYLNSLDIQPYQGGFGGLAHTLRLLKDRLEMIYKDGSEDHLETYVELDIDQQPRLSLQGTTAYARRTYELALLDSLTKRRQETRIGGMVRYKVGSTGGAADIEILSADLVDSGTDYTLIADSDGVLDFTFDYEKAADSGNYPVGVSVPVMDLQLADKANVACSGIFILPDALLNKKIRNIEVLPFATPRFDNAFIRASGGQTVAGNTAGFQPHTPAIIQVLDSSNDFSNTESVATVKNVTYYDSRMEQQTVVGVKVHFLYPYYFTSTLANYEVGYRVSLILDVN